MKIDRRFFVASSVAALLCASPALAKLRGAPSSTSSFFGNPNVTISAINTSPSTVVITGDTSINAANGLSGASNLNPASGTNQNGYMVKNLSSVTGLYAGMKISGTGIPSNAVIIYVDSRNNFLFLDQPATATGTGVTLTCGGNAICCSRIVGNTPAVFHVSADFITATGTTVPYEDLHFAWNFGDTSGTNASRTFVRPTDGATIYMNTDQIGPEAAYIYDTAGTYTITLTITGKSSGGYIVSTATQQVTVNDFSSVSGFTEIYIDTVNGNDANNGSTPALAKKDLSFALATSYAQNTQKGARINLANGSSWSASANMLNLFSGTLKYYNSGLRIRGYNPSLGGFSANTTKPILSTSSGWPIKLDNSTGSSSAIPKYDVVISGLSLRTTGGVGQPFLGACATYGTDMNAPIAFCYVVDCDTLCTTGSAYPAFTQARDCPAIFCAGFWNTTMGVSSGSTQGCNSQVRMFHLHIGNTYSGNGTNAGSDHFIYPQTREHSLFAFNTFSPGAVSVTGRDKCINLTYDVYPGSFEYSRCHYIGQNFMSGVQTCLKAEEGFWDTATWTGGTANFTLTNGAGNNAFPTVGATLLVTASSFLSQSMPSNYTNNQFYTVSASAPVNQGTGTIQLSGGTPTGTSGTVRVMLTLFKNFVVERNLVQNMSGNVASLVQAQTITMRYNRVIAITSVFVAFDSYEIPFATAKFYGNRVYGSQSQGSANEFLQTQGTAGWTNPMTVTDNIVYNASATPQFLTWTFANQVSAGSIVDRNNWYGPNGGLASSAGTGTVFNNNGTGLVNYANFKAQGWETNGTVADPGWTIPPTQWSHFGA